MAATDNDLVERICRGDAAGLALLAERYDGEAYALAYRLLQNAATAEDIRQTAFLRAFGRLGEFNGRAAFSTWLFRIVINLCRDWHRSQRVREKVLQKARDAHLQEQAAAPATGDGPEEAEMGRRVARAVRALPRQAREVVVMRHYMDLKFTEIAEILETPVSTVKSRMAVGLKLLRDSLEDIQL
ncbi:MAG: sigma-70 family RNA polymerase sigma factor [Phycisphaerales bacterium]|nr:MAG: sigma-70 family RNA polymerase sigma factor [Phycisphaerales bacterium]